MAHLPRLYLAGATIALGEPLLLSGDQSHYLHRARRKFGGEIELFNGRENGFYLAELIHNQAIPRRFVPRTGENPMAVALGFGVPEKGALEFLIEKGCEMGVTRFFPLRTRFTQGDSLKYLLARRERLLKIIESACCQCKRTRIPTLEDPIPLVELPSRFRALHPEGTIHFLEPMADGDPPVTPAEDCPRLLIIGPEGGFSDEERDFLSQQGGGFSLGDRILRVETAGLAGLALLVYS